MSNYRKYDQSGSHLLAGISAMAAAKKRRYRIGKTNGFCEISPSKFLMLCQKVIAKAYCLIMRDIGVLN